MNKEINDSHLERVKKIVAHFGSIYDIESLEVGIESNRIRIYHSDFVGTIEANWHGGVRVVIRTTVHPIVFSTQDEMETKLDFFRMMYDIKCELQELIEGEDA